MPKFLTTEAHSSAISSMRLVVGLPAPWPALVSMRIKTGLPPFSHRLCTPQRQRGSADTVPPLLLFHSAQGNGRRLSPAGHDIQQASFGPDFGLSQNLMRRRSRAETLPTGAATMCPHEPPGRRRGRSGSRCIDTSPARLRDSRPAANRRRPVHGVRSG